MRQPTLFEGQNGRGKTDAAADYERVVLIALGEFQNRGKVLAERDLPLDRLRGALRRAAERFGVEDMSDEQAAAVLGRLGGLVRRVPSFVAKHPFRVIVPTNLAERSRRAYQEAKAQK